MFANLFPISRRTPVDYERRFVESAVVHEHSPNDRKTERLLLTCWIVIALKCALVAWAVPHYHMPFSALWVIVPTLLFMVTVTAAFYMFRE